MADNTQLSTNVGVGDKITTAEFVWSGDTAKMQVIAYGFLTGGEGSWAFTQAVAGAGVVGGGVQRVTLASDDPAVALLATIDADTGAIKTAVELFDNIVHVEDSVHASGDSGAFVLAVRNDTLAALATTDGDYAPLQVNATGALYVSVSGTVTVGSHAVTNAGTFAVQVDGNALTALQLLDDIVHLEDAAHSGGDAGAMLLAVRNDTPGALATTDGDYIPLTTDSAGRLYTSATQSGTWNIGTVTTVTSITNSVTVVGAAAEDDAASGNPVLIGGRYDSTARTLDNGDVGAPALSPAGEMIIIPQTKYVMDGATRCEVKHINTTTSTSDTSLISAVAGKRFRILSIKVIGLSTTATNFHLETKTTNTDCWGDSTNPIPVSVDADGDNHSGIVLNWNPGGWFETADANEDLAIILSAAQPVTVIGNYIEVD